MALKVVSMEELKLEVLFEPDRSGESVVAVCRRRGISRASFYRYRQRYLAEGADGLQAKPRQPLTSPARIDPRLEQAICKRCASSIRVGVRAGSARSSLVPASIRRRSRRSTAR